MRKTIQILTLSLGLTVSALACNYEESSDCIDAGKTFEAGLRDPKGAIEGL